jgi:hypothetical protein
MKNVITFILFACLLQLVNAQTPQGISFQAVARDPSGNAAKFRQIFIIDRILLGSATGAAAWEEKHTVTTNAEGVFTIVIGKGSKSGGSVSTFSSINWASGIYFFNLKVAVQPSLPNTSWTPDANYVDMGASQFWSVPYAFYAGSLTTPALLASEGDPSPSTGKDGDTYLNTITHTIFGPRTNGNWGVGKPLVGPKGAIGETGAVGPQGPRGLQGAAGEKGSNGAIWYAGAEKPNSTLGSVQDFYINTGNGDYYKKNDSSNWTLLANLKGPKGDVGPQGATGLTGATGPQGVKGDTGAQGPIGLTGPTGPQGATGLTGATGPQGLKGDTGAQGLKGDTGAQGPIGLTGPTGPQGATGLKGDTGAQGLKGDTGAQGPIGLTGPTGPQGATGLKGDTGTQGPIGLTGSTGSQGPIGLTGATGPQGLKGDPGAQGATGLTGATGPQGPIGLTGASGPEGQIGLTGATGPQGLKGDTGAQGPIGLTGPTGPQGTIGLTGPIGPQGATGLTGATGPQGLKGDTGAQGPIGLTGPTGPQGATGLTGATGPQGLKGDTGAQGPIGLTGPTGPQGAIGLTGATGPQGLKGDTGAQGTIGLTGPTGPQGTAGLKGETGVQGPEGPQGLPGINGKAVLNGLSDPASGIGEDGDFYINTTSNNLFGPKNLGNWPTGISLIGPQGPAGSNTSTNQSLLSKISSYHFPNQNDYYWGLAVTFAAGYSFDGYNDWHLPSQEEMITLISKFGSSIFSNGNYWTSSNIVGGLNSPGVNYSSNQPVVMGIGGTDLQGNPIGPVFSQISQHPFSSNNPGKAKIVLVR